MRGQRLKHVAEIRVSNVDKKAVEGDAPVLLCNYVDVYYNERITGDMDFMSATATADQRVTFALKRGDVVLTKDSETADDIGVSAVVAEEVPDLVCGYHLAVVRAKSDVAFGPYLRWVLAGDAARQSMRMAATGVTRFGLRSDAIADLEVVLPSLDQQRAIADRLDRETARIDALIAARRRMVELVEERRRSAVEQALWGRGTDLRQATTLRRVASRVDVGIAEAATHAYADTGVPLVRSMNIRENVIDDRDLLFIAPWFANRNRSKYARTDDILTVRTGNVGVSALVPERLDHSQCFTQLITTVASPHLPEFVCLALNSQRAREYFLLTGWGSAQANISVPILSGAPIPVVDPSEQAGSVERAKAINDYAAAMTSALRRQGELLEERRRALVTAAVTGGLPTLLPA